MTPFVAASLVLFPQLVFHVGGAVMPSDSYLHKVSQAFKG